MKDRKERGILISKVNQSNVYNVTALRRFSMKITNLDKVEKSPVTMEGATGAHRQAPLSRYDGAPNFSMRVFTLEPNGHTPFHKHPFEHLNYIIRGDGVVVVKNGEEREVHTEDFVLVLPNEHHQYKNKSAHEPFTFICAVPKEYE